MVFIKDEGSRFHAPLDRVWKYMMDGERHDAAHATTRNGTFEPLSKTSMIYAAERWVDGTWVPERMRITVIEPVAVATEFLTGRFAGSAMVYVYRPTGDATEIDVYGNFRSDTVPADRLERTVLEFLESEFNEDTPAIQAYVPNG